MWACMCARVCVRECLCERIDCSSSFIHQLVFHSRGRSFVYALFIEPSGACESKCVFEMHEYFYCVHTHADMCDIIDSKTHAVIDM